MFVLVQTVFFTKPVNLVKFGDFFSYTFEKSSRVGHSHPFLYYLDIVRKSEISFLGITAFALISLLFLRKYKVKTLFLLSLSFFPFIVLSFVKYKTPWTLTTLCFPFFLFSGEIADAVFKRFKQDKKYLLVIFGALIVLLTLSTVQSISSNFIYYADEQNPLNYVGTSKDINKMMTDLLSLSSTCKTKKKVLIASTDYYWPLPFYLEKNGFEVNYVYSFATFLPYETVKKYDFIIADPRQSLEITSKFKKRYELREKVWVVLWAVTLDKEF